MACLTDAIEFQHGALNRVAAKFGGSLFFAGHVTVPATHAGLGVNSLIPRLLQRHLVAAVVFDVTLAANQ